MWVINWVHCRTTDSWAAAHMTLASSLTNTAILVVDIAYLTDGCHTQNMDLTLFARGQAKKGVITFLCHQLCTNACTTCQLTTTTTFKFDIVNGCTSWNVL
jgi:hypothetical protein